MAYTYVPSTEHNIYPNMTVYDRFWNETEADGWRVNANEGYVFYDANANDTRIDPITGDEVPVIYYYTVRALSYRYNWANFALVAVPRDSVPADQIFGGDKDPAGESIEEVTV